MSGVTFLFGKMAGVYTEDTLKALEKAYFTDLFLKMQDEMNSAMDSLMEELKDLSNSSKDLEPDFLKLGYWILNNPEYWKAMLIKCPIFAALVMEVIDIPKTVELKDLAHIVCDVFNSTVFDDREDKIEACH